MDLYLEADRLSGASVENKCWDQLGLWIAGDGGRGGRYRGDGGIDVYKAQRKKG